MEHNPWPWVQEHPPQLLVLVLFRWEIPLLPLVHNLSLLDHKQSPMEINRLHWVLRPPAMVFSHLHWDSTPPPMGLSHWPWDLHQSPPPLVLVQFRLVIPLLHLVLNHSHWVIPLLHPVINPLLLDQEPLRMVLILLHWDHPH